MKNHYIQAVLEMMHAGKSPDAVILGLKNALTAKGHMRLYSSVLKGVLRVVETKKDISGAVVTVATAGAVEAYTARIQESLTVLGAEGDFVTKIDPTIIGGVIVKSNNTVIDSSYKTALTNLYRATTK